MVATPSYVLELKDGQSGEPSLELRAGLKIDPMSIGRHGRWAVEAKGMLDHHAFLYFDGTTLFLQSIDDESPVLCDGQPLPKAWTRVIAPCAVAMGAAELVFRPLLELDDDTIANQDPPMHPADLDGETIRQPPDSARTRVDPPAFPRSPSRPPVRPPQPTLLGPGPSVSTAREAAASGAAARKPRATGPVSPVSPAAPGLPPSVVPRASGSAPTLIGDRPSAATGFLDPVAPPSPAPLDAAPFAASPPLSALPSPVSPPSTPSPHPIPPPWPPPLAQPEMAAPAAVAPPEPPPAAPWNPESAARVFTEQLNADRSQGGIRRSAPAFPPSAVPAAATQAKRSRLPTFVRAASPVRMALFICVPAAVAALVAVWIVLSEDAARERANERREPQPRVSSPASSR